MNQTDILFSYDDFNEVIREFVEMLPTLLTDYPETAKLALEVVEFKLTEALTSHFTVAIAGELKAGKSTLINSLIGTDLAPVGTDLTTATINWFKYDKKLRDHDTFCVHWSDGFREYKPLADIQKWSGISDDSKRNAAQTEFLEFYAASPLLRDINIVDTPGRDSPVKEHTQRTDQFLLQNRESELHKQVDAIVYVISNEGLEEDAKFLQEFNESLFPGCSPHNSIAVLQKWDTAHGENSLDEAHKKCGWLRKNLEGCLSDILPTSGLLANAYRNITDEEVWANLAYLGTESTDKAFGILKMSLSGQMEVQGAALSLAERQHLSQSVDAALCPPVFSNNFSPGWPVISFSLELARSENINCGKVLRKAIWEASGIGKLRTLLYERFISHAKLIKAGTVLRKVWEPLTAALFRLDEIKQHRKVHLQRIEESLRVLNSNQYAEDLTLAPARSYIKDSLSRTKSEIDHIDQLANTLICIRDKTEINFRQLDEDVKYLQALTELHKEGTLFLKEDIKHLQVLTTLDEIVPFLCRLFGQSGTEVWTRLGLDESELNLETMGRVEALFEDLQYLGERSLGKLKYLYSHAANRLQDILDYLEENLNE